MDSGLAWDCVLRNERGSELAMELEAIGFETATGSLFECINAAMDAEGLAPASTDGRTRAKATCELMLEMLNA